MLARAGVVGLVCLAVLAAAADAKAPGVSLLVRPGSPTVGLMSTIDVQLAPARPASPVIVGILSPTGLQSRLALKRVGPGLWRAAYRFVDDGTWRLSASVGRLTVTDMVFVKQPPSAVPPFALAPGSKPTLWGSGQGIGILIRP